jgi:Lysozyme like domain
VHPGATLCGMSTLNAEEIARVAYRAGFRGHALTTAVAVALAESNGNPKAHNPVPPDNSYGLWQINMYGSLGPARRHQFHLDSNAELFKPSTNARAAFSISSHGNDFTPWTTYTSGAYRHFLDRARRAAREVSRHHGHEPAQHKQGQHGGQGHGGQGQSGHQGSGGFAVDTNLLDAYVKRTRAVADGLSSINGTQVHRIRQIADDSFGKIGKETGFASALDDFAVALRRQVHGVGGNADKLASATAKTARTYRRQDDEIAGNLDGTL